MGLPLSRYPRWKVSRIVPSSCSSEGWPMTASCTLGSKGCPSEATGRRPSLPSTSASWSRVARTPSRMSPSASSARSRLSRTGRSSITSLSEAVSRMRERSRCWRLRAFSNSAFRRRSASRYSSRSRRTVSSSSTRISSSSSTAAGSSSSSASPTVPGSSPGWVGEAGSSGEPWASSIRSEDSGSRRSSGSRLFSSPLKALVFLLSVHQAGGGARIAPTLRMLLALLVLLLLVVDDLGVLDHVVIGVGGASGARLLLLLGLLVENLRELVGGGHQRLLLGLDLLYVAAGEGFLGLLYGLLYLELGVWIHLSVKVLERPLDRVHQVVGVVADVGLLAPALILLGVRFRVADHALDLLVREPAGGRDRDPLLLAGPQILGPDVDDAVGVYVERDLDLGHAPGRGRDPHQLEVADELVVRRHLALALEDLDLYRVLVVVGGREHLGLARGYGGVPLDELGEHPALGLDSKTERRHVEEQHVLDLAREHAGLDGGANRDYLIRVDALVGLLARELFDLLLYRRDTGRASDQYHLVHLARLQARVLHRPPDRPGRRLDEVRGQVVELRPTQGQIQVLGAVLVRGDERQVDRGARSRRQLSLGLLGRLDEPLGRHLVLREVYALALLELRDHPLDNLGVEVVAAEVVVAARGLDLEDPVSELEDGDVERPAAEVEDQDGLVLLLVQPVGQGRRGRLVDDPLDVEPGDAPRVLGRLALGIFEVGRNGDDRLGYLLAQILLGIPPELLQDHGRDLRRRVFLLAHLDPDVPAGAGLDLVAHPTSLFLDVAVAPTHEALDRVDGALRVRHGLPSRQLPDQTLPTPPVERYYRGRRPLPLGVRDHRRVATLQYRHTTVGGTQVYANALGHAAPPTKSRYLN